MIPSCPYFMCSFYKIEGTNSSKLCVCVCVFYVWVRTGFVFVQGLVLWTDLRRGLYIYMRGFKECIHLLMAEFDGLEVTLCR